MRRATLPIELLLLAFLGLFLVYPLVYILPGAASDEELVVESGSTGTSRASSAITSPG